LQDGSVITLNTDTEIRLRYSRAERGVELVTGQANFEVAKDPKRPFIVSVAGSHVRAVGTVFDIYKSDRAVTVTLIEGKVAFTPGPVAKMSGAQGIGQAAFRDLPGRAGSSPSTVEASGGPSPELVLTAGQQLSFAPASGLIRESAADLPRVSAWRAHKLDFSNTPLFEAIAEANRYSRL